jgi:thymidylate synthase
MKNIAVLNVKGKTLAEAYEKALVELYENGTRFKTQYDKEGDPESIDATMNITIEQPMTDPMIHKAFPGGIADLKEYVMEIQGVKDHWVKNMDDPNDTRWEYTYHGRFVSYGQWKGNKRPFEDVVEAIFNEKTGGFDVDTNPSYAIKGFQKGVNQIEAVIDKLCKQPFTRQAQIITWMPNLDLDIFDPPCLQSCWYRMAEEDGEYYLNCNIRFRSNDAWGAYFMNSFGFTMFNREIIANEIEKRMNKKVHLARMNWHADSWHIYGKDISQAKARFFDRLKTTSFEDRVYNFSDDVIQEMYNEAEQVVLDKIKVQDEKS